ncbi:MAG: GTPase Era [Acidobacteria bacterium]|nr:GTPase Era [Acidobacteriota bacterium]
MRSGLVAVVGRPNVGKSSLVNAIVGSKVSIVSDKPQTTRRRIHGVATSDDAQIVFVDTPGLHKAVTALGERVNATALASTSDVDVVVLVFDAAKGFGKGDEWVAANVAIDRSSTKLFVVANKCDGLAGPKVLKELSQSDVLGADEYFPLSARSGKGVEEFRRALFAVMPEGPWYYPDGETHDLTEEEWVAELVREELLRLTREEIPYSIATRVTEWEWPRVKCEIIVERESQKGMVIGRGGQVLREVGEAVRKQMSPGAFLELRVVVDKDWQRRPGRIERLGY